MNKTMSALAAAGLLLGTAPGIAAAAKPGNSAPAPARAAASGDARIPFVGFGGIRNWRAAGDSIVFLQGSNGQWYRADLAGPCDGLPFALRLGVQTGGTDTLDSFSNLVVGGQRCPIASVTRISGPPPRSR